MLIPAVQSGIRTVQSILDCELMAVVFSLVSVGYVSRKFSRDGMWVYAPLGIQSHPK